MGRLTGGFPTTQPAVLSDLCTLLSDERYHLVPARMRPAPHTKAVASLGSGRLQKRKPAILDLKETLPACDDSQVEDCSNFLVGGHLQKLDDLRLVRELTALSPQMKHLT